jgi:hypothetical protein
MITGCILRERMRKFFSDLSGKEAPSVLDVGFGAAGRALGLVKRGAQNVAVVFKKKEEDMQTDQFILFNRTIESIHSVVLLFTAKHMDSAECSQLQLSQTKLQHMAQHLQVNRVAITRAPQHMLLIDCCRRSSFWRAT